ncbi:hypothetical protein [Cryobacterium sp. M23]|uniref:hypothetical protein n=1 Tax=Cryobacterium sp. M23 TaxID=2048292 RepID=UPI00351A5C2A
MVLAQLNVGASDALLILQGYAFSHARTVREVADDVVARRVDFTSELDRYWDGIMVTRTREGQLVETFVTLADPLVVGYDVVDLLHTLVETCATLFGASAVGIILSAYNDNDLEVMASTNERSRLIEILQLRAGNGPCVECYTTGYPWPFPTSMSSPRRGHGSGRERSNSASSRCIRFPCGCERRPSDRSISSGIASAVWERRTCARSGAGRHRHHRHSSGTRHQGERRGSGAAATRAQ